MKQNSTTGLSAAEVAERIARGEVNRVRHSDRAAYADIAARNLLTVFNALVVPAAVALFALGEYRDAIAVSGMALTNTALGLVQEIRAKRHLDRLALLAETTVHVVRDAAVTEILSGDVVRGDLVLLGAGDAVIADGELTEARYLEVDEALLSGESDPVPRKAGERVLSGSFAVAGEGRYVADRVGADAYAPRTAAEARRYRFTASPLQQSVNRIIRILTATAVALCVLYIFLGPARGFSGTEVVQMVAATITSMVPQGLVLMVTLAFVLGAVRLAARGAVAQRLDAVETMAAIDTLCMDKTGTLTTNELLLREVVVLADDLTSEEVRRRLGLFAAASLDRGNRSVAALRAATGDLKTQMLDCVPFKSQNRYSAVRLRDGERERTLALGAVEALAALLQPDEAARISKKCDGLGRTGLRLLLFAESVECRPFGGSLEGFALRPLAVVALGDELRPEAAAVLQALADQGIDFKVLSGDNCGTVRATVEPLAEAAGLSTLVRTEALSGAELEAAADPVELMLKRSVFGRVSPWQKVQIVTALKEAGRRVAMIGDGVNDVLPIKTADLGVAMGTGSRAAKTVAGLVLTTDRFDLIPATLDEGRVILRNVRRAGKLFLVKNVFTVLLIAGALALFALPFPFLPRQVTLLNALTIGIPALLIMLDRERATAVRSDFLREVGSFVLRTGIVLGVAGTGLQWYAARVAGEDTVVQRTLLLTALVLLGLTNVLRVLTDGEARPLRGDRKFYPLVVLALAAYLGVMYWGPAAGYFALEPLSTAQWAIVLAAVVPSVAVLLVSDFVVKRLRR